MATSMTALLPYVVMILLASVLQLAWAAPDGPQWILLVLSWRLVNTSSQSPFWSTAALGLLIDLLGSERLGLHLAVAGVATAVAMSLRIGDRCSRWVWPGLAAGLVLFDHGISAQVLNWIQGQQIAISAVSGADLSSAASTAGVALAFLVIATVGQRLIAGGVTPAGIHLRNSWAGLAEH